MADRKQTQHRTHTFPRQLAIAIVLVVLIHLAPAWGRAGDWPQLLGPDRDGHAHDESLAGSWSRQPPTQRWSARVGQGYAGPAIQGSHVLLFHRLGNEEILTCLASSDGKTQWEQRWPTSYAGGVDPDQGPRCVPLVHQDAVYTYGAAGDLHSTTLAEGKRRWSRKLAKEYGARDGYFGVGAGPMVVGNRLLVNVGGRDGASIVALDLETGATQWTQLSDDASYAAPVLWNSSRGTQAVFITRLRLAGLDPTSGQLQFTLPFGKRGPTVNAASPLIIDEHRVFVTASYGIGAKLVSLRDQEAQIEWASDDVLSSQYPTPVLNDGHLYGVHGREDGPPAELRCVDVNTGKVRWRKPQFGMAHLIVADNKLLVQRTAGEVLLLAPDTASYRELGSVRVSQSVARAHPALANGLLVVRNIDGQVTAWQLP